MKKYILGILSLFLLFACGDDSEKKNTAETKTEKVFYLSGRDRGGETKVGYFWQAGEDLVPYLLSRALLISNSEFNKLEPDLAENFKVLENGKVYTMKLKEGLKWSDGEPLTTEDVRFSFETALKVSLINGIFPENLLKIEGAEDFKKGNADHISGLEIDGNNIKITLTNTVGMFSQILAQLTLMPKHCLENENILELHNSKFWTQPVTNGMYRVKRISSGNFFELERNPYYEGKAPKIDKVIYSYISSPILAMQDGKSYYYSTTKLQEITQLDTVNGIVKHPVDLLFYRYFIANLSGIGGAGDSQLSNPKVREAILYAINRKELVSSLLKGVAVINNTGVPTDMVDNYWKDANTYEYNPEKAKELLKEANYNFEKPLKLTYYYKDQTSGDLMQAISYQLKAAGIENEVVQIQSDPTTALFKTRKYDLALKGFSSFGFESWYGEYTSRNTNFKNIYNGDTSFDNLTQKLATTVDKDERKQILIDLQKLEQEKLFKVPLYTIKNFIFINEDKVELPEGLKFGNPFYRHNYHFEDWDVK